MRTLQAMDGSFWQTDPPNFGLVYFSISPSLNILLTLVIIIRLILHNGIMIRNVMWGLVSGLHKVIITMPLESCALDIVGPSCTLYRGISKATF